MKKLFKISGGAVVFLVAVGILSVIGLYFFTWFRNKEDIDQRDLEHWEYTEKGIIKQAKEIELEGHKDTCWLFVHGYTSVPNEFENYATEINEEFGDYVYVPRLYWHGTKPSDLLGYKVTDWKNQILEKYNSLESNCQEINMVGFSLWGLISLWVAQEKIENFGRLYLIAPFIRLNYVENNWFSIEEYADDVWEELVYWSKINIAQVNKPQAEENHIAYWNFPFEPITSSFDFYQKVRNNLSVIEIPVQIHHWEKDVTNNIQGSEKIYDQISSEKKEFHKYPDSNHVLMRDYAKNKVLENIMEFEKQFR